MKVITTVVGSLQTNCYLLIDEETKSAALIDPGDEAEKLLALVKSEGVTLTLDDVGGELLIVSQFTLYGNCRKGRRPEFLSAARPEIAIPMYEKFVEICREKGYHVETGEFGAYMEVESLNDGPFTLIVDSADLDAPKKQ